MAREAPVIRTTRLMSGERGARSADKSGVAPRSALRLPRSFSRFFLVPLLERCDDGRIGQRGDVAERAALADVAQETPHDFPGSGLRQVGGDEDLLRPRDRADLLRDV